MARNIVHGANARGFSLIDLMVGLAVGLLAVVAIAASYSAFENQKQRTTAGADAQENGLMAIAQIEQDARNAGAGFANSAAYDCSTYYTYLDTGSGTPGPLTGYGFAAVSITDGGSGSDTVTIRSGSQFLGSLPTTITSTMPQPSSELNVSRTYGFSVNDLVVVSQGGNCTLMQVTQVQDAALKLQHNPGGTPAYNPAASYQNDNHWPAYTTGAKVMDAGQMVIHSYTVSGNELTVTDNSIGSTSTTQQLISGIVDLQAQYGIADAGSQTVNHWVDAIGTWAAPSASDIKRIKAVRLVIVARAGKNENANVSAPCTNVSGTVNNGPCAWADSATDPAPLIDLSSDASWRHYRYRVYQTIIPLKNVIWANI